MSTAEERKKLAELLAKYIDAGATDIALPDTMGIVTDPARYVELFHDVQEKL